MPTPIKTEATCRQCNKPIVPPRDSQGRLLTVCSKECSVARMREGSIRGNARRAEKRQKFIAERRALIDAAIARGERPPICGNCGIVLDPPVDFQGNVRKTCGGGCSTALRIKAAMRKRSAKVTNRARGELHKTPLTRPCEQCFDLPWRRERKTGCPSCRRPYADEGAPQTRATISHLGTATRWAP